VTVFTTTAQALEGFWSPRQPCLPSGVCDEAGVEVRRYSLWRCHGRRYLLKPLSLVPHRLWQCLTLPCNPIAFRMWADAGRPPRAVDVVHATALPYAWPIACALRMARRLQVPFALTPFLHLGDIDNPRDRTRRAYTAPPLLHLLRAADCLFVQTGLERELLLRLGMPEENVVLQGLGVDVAECTGGNRERVREEWGVANDEVVVGHLANHSVEKGTVDLLQAAQRLWHRGARFVLVLAGPEMPNFRQFWRRLVPAGRVVRLGVLSESQKKDFFAGLDVFALPSRSDSFGLVLLEAWANGVANVAYRAGGIAAVVRDGQDGRLVRCGAVEELAAALQSLITNRAERERLGAAGRERTREEFRWEDKLALVRQVYQDLITKPRKTERRKRK
jgi:glycosyltransferase involved in cell wall biosynthesis